MSLRKIAILCLMLALSASIGGCDNSRFNESELYKGMDRSVIVATYGPPDKRKVHNGVERLIYRDGDDYQFLLLLIDNKLSVWHHDRVYKEGRFSNIRN